jgi:hypothetical protein
MGASSAHAGRFRAAALAPLLLAAAPPLIRADAEISIALVPLTGRLAEAPVRDGDGAFLGNEVGKVLQPDLFEDAGGGRSRIRKAKSKR